ncbi:glycerol-3-phosphate dehydrogenase [Erythrobacter arachoides]|uniref:Glycerol-3-phosphate dehydrogenase n=1 Tax=Aurantiacibacter arachoides TaxID=1850444 RepID=A0A845A3L0_9SPHN|nr:glycerol-3-phosphate dehydrogenase [Aurantiacibacter arachoides]MXO94012.1 glycerol-3-phosphate dehydrogenase [Aurantiacibacter arachoides]GGD44763.1 glycerol-3-phosphate dehydrogenase [Aurantiacibacter arachoides]
MSDPFDLIVIGGGVNGAGVARDAAGRGARVLLLETGDLASGTSSKSTKLVHGGLRYLEYYEFALVREALGERDVLWSIAPHIVRPMRFVLPVSTGMRPRWMLRAGLFLYDHIGGRGAFRNARSIGLDRHPAGAPLEPGCTRGFEYSDGWVDDARLVVLNALDAAERGADIRPRTRVTSARREHGDWVVQTTAGAFRGRALVNAAGPAADELAGIVGERPSYGLRRVRGSHIVVPGLFDHDYAYILQQPDTRICFAIPWEGDFTLIGTTDADHDGSLDEVEASTAEVRYLCDAANRYFATDVTPGDVVHTFAGVRALIDDGTGRPEAATRGYRISLSEEGEGAPLLGIWGGKITSYRHVAEDACDKLAQRLPVLAKDHWTAHAPLPGGDFDRTAQHHLIGALKALYPFLDYRDALRIGRAYGTRAVDWLGEAGCWDDLGRQFNCGLSEAEVEYLRRVEWAVSAEDVLWRRTKLGLHMSAAEVAELESYLAR